MEQSPILPRRSHHRILHFRRYIYPNRQAFLGFERGQRCFEEPKVSNVDGTDLIDFKQSSADRVGKCVNQSGDEEIGLTFEGELNKVS